VRGGQRESQRDLVHGCFLHIGLWGVENGSNTPKYTSRTSQIWDPTEVRRSTSLPLPNGRATRIRNPWTSTPAGRRRPPPATPKFHGSNTPTLGPLSQNSQPASAINIRTTMCCLFIYNMFNFFLTNHPGCLSVKVAWSLGCFGCLSCFRVCQMWSLFRSPLCWWIQVSSFVITGQWRRWRRVLPAPWSRVRLQLLRTYLWALPTMCSARDSTLELFLLIVQMLLGYHYPNIL
jgi:hypothetical protein